MTSVTTVPQIAIRLAGTALDHAQLRSLAEVRVQQRLSQPALCELLWVSTGQRPLPVLPGEPLELLFDDLSVFSGDVTAVEHLVGPDRTAQMRVRAYDRLHRLRKRQNVRAYVDVALDELTRTLTSGDGLTVHCDVTPPVLRHVVQFQRSDFDLLADLVARSGLYFSVHDGVLHISDLTSNDGVTDTLTLGTTLMNAEFELNADTACAAVRTHAWDPAFAATRTAVAEAARLGREIDADVRPADTGGETRALLNCLADDDTQAQRAAQGELDRRAGRTIVFTGLAQGSASLRPGSRVRIEGAADTLCGIYTLTSVTHRIDGGAGFVSSLSTEPPPDPRQPSGATVTIGLVTQVEDPEARGRIRVRLPAYNDAETGWLPVVMPGVGQDKGIIAAPNIDDTVLLLSPDGDPARALIIGGLPGPGGPVDTGVSAGQVRRFLIRTAGGLSLSFDDAGKTIVLQDSAGSRVVLSPEAVLLQAATDLRIEAPGRSIRILADTVDFERG